MSASTAGHALGPAKQLPPGRYGLSGLLRSEWTKLSSVRSTMWTLGLTVVLGIGISALATIETRIHWTAANAPGFDPTGTSLIGVFFGQLTIGVLGVLVMSSEYSSGTIRATFAAAPRRRFVLAAKALVFGFVALVVSEIVSFLSFFIGQALLSAPAIHATIGSPGALEGRCRKRGLSLPHRPFLARPRDDHPPHGWGDQRLFGDPARGARHHPGVAPLSFEQDRGVHARPHRGGRRLAQHRPVLPPALDGAAGAMRLRGVSARSGRCRAGQARRLSCRRAPGATLCGASRQRARF